MNNEEIIKKLNEVLCKIAELFEQAFTELLKEKQSQAVILIKMNKAVTEFKTLQAILKKNEVEIDVKIDHIEAVILVKEKSKKIIKLSLTSQDHKFLRSLKIIPPEKDNENKK